MTKTLIAAPLRASAFAPFGSVIEIGNNIAHAINGGMAERYDRLAVAEMVACPGDTSIPRAIISLFWTKPCMAPVELTVMERHPLGSQAFMPLDGRPWLIVVAPERPRDDASNLHAFIASGDQGVSYAPGIWHHPLLALEQRSRFLVVDREDTENNLEEAPLAAPVFVTLTARDT